MCSASSASVGRRPSLASSVLIASLSLLALLRTRRGTQSIVRSSSSMAPRMRGTQYVSNFTPRVRSNASMASIRPKTPAEIRSSSSTPSGKPGPDALAVVLHQRQVLLDQPVAQVLVVQDPP